MLIHSFRSFRSLLLGSIVSKITANRSSDEEYIADQNCSPHGTWGEESLTRARKDTLQRSPHSNRPYFPQCQYLPEVYFKIDFITGLIHW